LTGFRGAHRDANMRMPDVQPMHADAEHGMSKLQTSIYKYVLDLYCTEACLTGRRLVRVAKEIVPVSDWNEV